MHCVMDAVCYVMDDVRCICNGCCVLYDVWWMSYDVHCMLCGGCVDAVYCVPWCMDDTCTYLAFLAVFGR